MLKDMKKTWLMEQAERCSAIADAMPKNKVSISKEWLAEQLYKNAGALGWEDGIQATNKNPFNSEHETEYFRAYEDEFQTRRAEEQQADEEAEQVSEPDPVYTVDGIKKMHPSEVTDDMRQFMREQGLSFTSAGWQPSLAMPKNSVKRERRASKGSIAPVVNTMLRHGKSDEEILKEIRRINPEAKTTSGCIAWYASKLRAKGEKLPNRPRNVSPKKKVEDTAAK